MRTDLLECFEHYYHAQLTFLYRNHVPACYFGHAGNMAIRASVFHEIGMFQGVPIVGDTEIIHRLIGQKPMAGVIYEPRAKVVHAEVKRFRDCLRKLFGYGQHTETYRMCSAYRPLNLREKNRC